MFNNNYNNLLLYFAILKNIIYVKARVLSDFFDTINATRMLTVLFGRQQDFSGRHGNKGGPMNPRVSARQGCRKSGRRSHVINIDR